MKSRMRHHVSIFVCIVVLAAVKLSKSMEPIRVEKPEDARKYLDIKRPEMELAPKKGFLVGEETPVWISRKSDKHSPVRYSRLPNFMKRALIDWRWKNGSVDAQANPSEKTVHEPSTSSITELHMSILVVMDMKMAKNTGNDSTVTIMEYERLLRYAVSFLNTVDDRLRSIDSDISIHLAGVVIGENRKATEYIHWSQTRDGTFYERSAVMFMHRNWTRIPETYKFFSRDAYDFVITITDIKPKKIIPFDLNNNNTVKEAKNSYKILTFLVIDDGMFSGVRSIANELLAVISELRPSNDEKMKAVRPMLARKRPYYKLEHLSIDITRFRAGLSKEKRYHHPGKPLETRLFRDISDKQEQCMAYALDYDKSCWNPMKCDDFFCRKGKQLCLGIGSAKDGTTCGMDRMCINGECVSKADPKYD